MSTTYHFQKELPDELDIECPICFDVLLESPYLTDCCGRHFCGHCVYNLTAAVSTRHFSRKSTNNMVIDCPMCKSRNCKLVRDKSLERVLGNQYVNCTHWNSNDTSVGCTWEGELRNLKDHLYDTCQYVEVKCPHRGCPQGKIKRYDYKEHVESLCSERPFMCEFCYQDGSYSWITNSHYQACEYYPVECPLICSSTVPRCEVMSHLENDCPLQTVSCVYSPFGCKVKPKRQDLASHHSTPHHDIIILAYMKLVDRIKELETQSKQTKLLFGSHDNEMRKTKSHVQEQFQKQDMKRDDLKDQIEQQFETYKEETQVQLKANEMKINEVRSNLCCNIVLVVVLVIILLIVCVIVILNPSLQTKLLEAMGFIKL